MTGFFAVYKREVAHIFRTSIAYGIAFALFIFVGFIFTTNLSTIAQQQDFAAQGFGAPPNVTATDLIVSNLGLITFLMFLVAPLLTMRLISEETREGTLEVLMTLPMGDWAFVAGKFFAAWTFYTVLLLLSLVHLVVLTALGPVNAQLVATAYLGAWLYGGAAIALTLIWSAMTEDQIVSAFLGAATILVFFLMDQFAVLASGQFAQLGNLMRELGFAPHFQTTLLSGVLRAQDVVYFLLMIAVSLFITTLIVTSRRWRA